MWLKLKVMEHVSCIIFVDEGPLEASSKVPAMQPIDLQGAVKAKGVDSWGTEHIDFIDNTIMEAGVTGMHYWPLSENFKRSL